MPTKIDRTIFGPIENDIPISGPKKKRDIAISVPQKSDTAISGPNKNDMPIFVTMKKDIAISGSMKNDMVISVPRKTESSLDYLKSEINQWKQHDSHSRAFESIEPTQVSSETF